MNPQAQALLQMLLGQQAQDSSVYWTNNEMIERGGGGTTWMQHPRRNEISPLPQVPVDLPDGSQSRTASDLMQQGWTPHGALPEGMSTELLLRLLQQQQQRRR